jgi:predicted deacetylase
MVVAASLGTESVQGAALSLESVDDIERGDRLALCVLGVLDRMREKGWWCQKDRKQHSIGRILTVTESRMTLSRKSLRHPRVSS